MLSHLFDPGHVQFTVTMTYFEKFYFSTCALFHSQPCNVRAHFVFSFPFDCLLLTFAPFVILCLQFPSRVEGAQPMAWTYKCYNIYLVDLRNYCACTDAPLLWWCAFVSAVSLFGILVGPLFSCTAVQLSFEQLRLNACFLQWYRLCRCGLRCLARGFVSVFICVKI